MQNPGTKRQGWCSTDVVFKRRAQEYAPGSLAGVVMHAQQYRALRPSGESSGRFTSHKAASSSRAARPAVSDSCRRHARMPMLNLCVLATWSSFVCGNCESAKIVKDQLNPTTSTMHPVKSSPRNDDTPFELSWDGSICNSVMLCMLIMCCKQQATQQRRSRDG